MLRPLDATLRELAGVPGRDGDIARAGIAGLRRLWASADGQAIFAMLAMVAHPYASRVRETPQETGQADGRAEMVGALIILAAGGAIAPHILTNTNPHEPHATTSKAG